MSRSLKVLVIAFSSLVLLLVSGWGLVYASSAQFMKQGPAAGEHLSFEKPTISAAWPSKAGVKLIDVSLTVDGQDVTGNIAKSLAGFTYTPKEPMRQGGHEATAVMEYSVFMVPKTVTLKWDFSVDTIAPPLQANEGRYVFATGSSEDSISGYTEPDAKLSVKTTGPPASISTEENGRFDLLLTELGPKQWVRLTAVDPAGNTTTRDVKVILDNSAPTIASMNLEADEVIHDDEFQLKIKIKDSESFVSKAKITVDGNPVSAVLKGGTVKTAQLGWLSDGKHELRVEINDAAGNAVEEKLSFGTDSRRIVINRAERRLYLYKEGKLWHTWRVAVGTPRYPTPRGDFKIEAKRYRPTWVNPGSGWAKTMPARIGPGPGNPLGTRAMNLNVSGIRIHGTYAAYSIGTAASHGCIRMRLRDVEALYDLVEVGTPVLIQ